MNTHFACPLLLAAVLWPSLGRAQAPTTPPREVLSLQSETPATRLSAAVAAARSGRFNAAVALLAKDTSQRLVDERTRATHARDFRREFLNDLHGNGRKLQVSVDGAKISGKITAIDAESCSVQGRRETRIVPLESLSPATLYAAGLKHRAFRDDRRWLAGYLLALAGDDRTKAERKLRGDGPIESALRNDLGSYYEIDDGTVALAIADLAEAPALDPGSCHEILSLLEITLPRHRSDPVVQRRVDALQQLAETALDMAFDPKQSDCLGVRAGQLEWLDEETIRLVYDFEDRAQIEDLILAPDVDPYGPEPGAETHEAMVIAGNLTVTGARTLLLPVPITAPWRIDYAYDLDIDEKFQVVAGVAIPRTRQWVAANGAGAGMFQDPKTNTFKITSDEVIQVDPKTHYTVTLTPEGEFTVARNDETPNTCDLPVEQRGGWPFLFASSAATLEFTHFAAEGQLDRTQLGEVRKRWIQRRMMALLGS